MTHIKLRYVHRFTDRHGRVRHYFRRGRQRSTLPGTPGSREFMEAYQAALAAAPPPIAQSRTQPGTIAALAVSWYQSADFVNLSPATQAVYRRIVDKLVTNDGDKPVKLLEARHIRTRIDAKGRTPSQANRLLSIFRLLMRHAVEKEWRRDDPTIGIRRVRYHAEGFATWTEEHIAAYEARWPVGTRERLALALLLFTGQRRSDIIRMGTQHVRDGKIEVRQLKTRQPLILPMAPELAAAISAAPTGIATFLVTALGHPFASGNAFYNWFVERARLAGIPPGLSPHGLRKASARRMAEGGAAPNIIGAVTGHRTLSEVARYTRAADQERLARTGVAMISERAAKV